MRTVTQDFLDKMRADRRRVDAKVTIDWTSPDLDQSITITPSDNAYTSYPQQVADGVSAATHKWASLDGSWVLDGTWHLAPEPDDLNQYQFGWWGSQLAGTDGSFVSPYPTLTITHLPRPIRNLIVVGDSARGEYPVDFTIQLYAQDNTLLYTETVTGNTAVSWSKTLTTPVLDVAKQVLTITKWSHPGRQAKILEFFTSIQETYYSGDIVEIRLLEEREASQGSLPVGNISANEIAIRLANKDGKFDLTNPISPLSNLLKPNRRIKAWLGAVAENAASENPPTYTRNSVAYKSDGTQVAANVPRYETGKFGQAVMVEEGTTNLISQKGGSALYNPRPSWLNADAEVVSDPDCPFGGYAVKLDATTNTTYEDLGSVGWTAADGLAGGDVFFLSFYAKWNKRITSDNRLWYTDGTYTAFEEQWVINPNPDPSIYQKYVIKYTVPQPASGKTINYISFTPWFYLDTDDTSIGYISPIICEKKPYATSFIDGARSPEILTIPTAGIMDPQEGTVEGWVKLLRSPSTNEQFILDGAGPANQNLQVVVRTDGKLETRYGTGAATVTVTGTTVLAKDTWYAVAVRWSSAGVALFLNGASEASSTTAPSLSFGANAYLGSDAAGANQLDGLIDSLRISSRVRTDEEIAVAYASGRELEPDEDTTYLLTFNGSIYPVEQIWIPLGVFWSLDWDAPDDVLEANTKARDRLELLRKSTYKTGTLQQNVSLYTLAQQVLQDAGLQSADYAIDTALQPIVVPWGWLPPMSHRDALRLIAEAGLAVVYADRDGIIRIQSMANGLGATPVLTITADDYFPPLSSPAQQENTANEIIVTATAYQQATGSQEVYRSQTAISIPAGETVTVTVQYNKIPVFGAIAGLVDSPSGVSITAVTYYAGGAEVSIWNTNTSAVNVTLSIWGYPLEEKGGERVVARDQTSIWENGLLRYEFSKNHLVQTRAQAQAIADALLASAKDPRRDLEFEWRGNPALELGDKVTVVGQDVHVIRQELNWAGYLTAKLVGRKVN